MSAIPIQVFGGIAPSADPRALPADGAQVARNLDMRFGDFRPLPGLGTQVTAVTAAAKSVFRTPSGVWLSSTNDVNYVNGQLNDTPDERVYLTGRSAYPEAWQDGVYRRLGVPAPDAAPAVELVESDEFTADEAAIELERIYGEMMTGVEDNLDPTTLGTAPTPNVPVGVSVDILDEGDDWDSWTKSESHIGGFNQSAVGQSTLQGNPQPSYYTLVDEADGIPAYAYRNFGVKECTQLDVSFDFQVNWGDLSSTYPHRMAQFGVQCDEQGRGFCVYIDDTGNGLTKMWVGTQSSWANRGARSADTTAPGDLARLTIYTVQVAIRRASSGTSTIVTKLLKEGTQIAEVTATGTFSRGDYCGFTGRSGVDAFNVIDSLPFSGIVTYYDNIHVAGSGYTGFWLPDGTDVGSPSLPTTEEGDYAYLARMNEGGTAMYSSTEEYLRDVTLAGTAVQYDEMWWYAVPVRKMLAPAFELDTAGFVLALTAIMGPDGTTQLLDSVTIDSIADDVTAMYAASEGTAKALLNDLNTAVANLLGRLAAYSKAGGNAAQIKIDIGNVTSASEALSAYYTRIDTDVRRMLTQRYGSDVSEALPTTVDRLVDTRAYVYTYVTTWGEESAPSLPSTLLEVDQNDAVTISVTAPPVDRNIVGWRLYRSSTSNVGAAYQLVADSVVVGSVLDDGAFDYFASSLTDYTDSKLQEELQESLQTLTWAEPPEDLKGLVGLPNGIMAGFFGKTVCFCEPYYPYAWPIEYQITVEHNIVGLGVFGQTLVVLTEGFPYYASGADSASMSAQKIEAGQACVGKRTIASTEGGVLFASPDGLCLAGGAGIQLLTLAAYDRDRWDTIRAAEGFAGYAEGTYYLVSPGAPDGCLMLDFASKRIGSMELGDSTTLYTDLLTDTIYAVIGAGVVPLFGVSRRLGVWRSKKFVVTNVPSFAWARVTGEHEMPSTLRMYGDGALVHEQSIGTGDPFRLPPGRWREIELELQGTSTVPAISIASSTAEMKA